MVSVCVLISGALYDYLNCSNHFASPVVAVVMSGADLYVVLSWVPVAPRHLDASSIVV